MELTLAFVGGLFSGLILGAIGALWILVGLVDRAIWGKR